MTATTRRKLRWAARSELTEHLIYNRVAQRMRDQHNREVIEKIAQDERQHCIRLETLLGEKVKPEMIQSILNALAAITLGILAIYLFVFTVRTVIDTYTYNSIAQTPWATPLIYPQVLWMVSMCVFAIFATVLAGRSIQLAAKRRWNDLNREFHPVSVEEELESELEDLKQR